jgi:hypothetical protein
MRRVLVWTRNLLLLLLFSELVLRLFFFEQFKPRIEPAVYREHPRYGFLPLPHLTATRSSPYSYQQFTLNNRGFTGPDFPAVKDSTRFRIVVVGFSNCEGYYVAPEENALRLLEKQLQDSGYRAEVLNCSIGGGYYRKLQQYWYAKEQAATFDADLLLFETALPFRDYFVSKDVYRGFNIEYSTGSGQSKSAACAVVDRIKAHPALTWLIDHLFLARALAKVYTRLAGADEGKGMTVKCLEACINNKVKYDSLETRSSICSFSKSLALLQALDTVYRNRGADVLVFQIPDVGSDARTKRFYDSMRAHGIPFVTTIDYGATSSDLYYKENNHLNSRGHRLLAEGLYRSITSGGFIPANFRTHKTGSQ